MGATRNCNVLISRASFVASRVVGGLACDLLGRKKTKEKYTEHSFGLSRRKRDLFFSMHIICVLCVYKRISKRWSGSEAWSTQWIHPKAKNSYPFARVVTVCFCDVFFLPSGMWTGFSQSQRELHAGSIIPRRAAQAQLKKLSQVATTFYPRFASFWRLCVRKILQATSASGQPRLHFTTYFYCAHTSGELRTLAPIDWPRSGNAYNSCMLHTGVWNRVCRLTGRCRYFNSHCAYTKGFHFTMKCKIY